MQIQDWQATAKAKVADIHSSIPKEWRLSDMDLDKAGQQRTLSGPFIEQYLTDEEKDIIRHDSIQIVGKIKNRECTAVDVTRAYCKTAAVAQQIVSHDTSCGASSIMPLNPLRTIVCTKSCSTLPSRQPRTWMITIRRIIQSKVPYTVCQLA